MFLDNLAYLYVWLVALSGVKATKKEATSRRKDLETA